MYGLPKDEHLAFFKGRTLLQVCFGVHDVILNFDGRVCITVTSSVGFMVTGDGIQQFRDFRQAAPALLSLLNQTIVCVDGDEAGTLAIKFDGGSEIFIYDDSREYESYTIKNGDQLIVV